MVIRNFNRISERSSIMVRGNLPKVSYSGWKADVILGSCDVYGHFKIIDFDRTFDGIVPFIFYIDKKTGEERPVSFRTYISLGEKRKIYSEQISKKI